MKNKVAVQKQIFIYIIICMLLSILVFSCAQETSTAIPSSTAQQSISKYGGILKIGQKDSGPIIGYPPQIQLLTSVQVAPVIETLLHLDDTGKLVPWLATGFTSDITDKSIILTLRKDVKFHDGTDFNAEAVKWNLDQQIKEKTPGVSQYKSVDIINDYSVRINLSQWDSTATSSLIQTSGLMVSPTAYKNNGIEWCKKNPVGTGPFQFVSYQNDLGFKFKKFNNYWQKDKPFLEGIEFIYITDSIPRELSFRKGEVDLLYLMGPQTYLGLEKDGYVITRRASGSGAYGLINDSKVNTPFKDIRVRQAMQYAIDAQSIVKSVCLGEGEPTNQFSYKAHWGYNPSVIGYPYNPTKAKQLLADAGYPNGFKTKILVPSGNIIAKDVSLAATGFLKAIGIDAELDLALTGRFQQIIYQGGTWEGLAWVESGPDPDILNTIKLKYSGGNFGGKYYQNMLIPDDYLKAIQNAVAASDFETKQKWVQEAQKIMIDKYALMATIYAKIDDIESQKYIHDHGFGSCPYIGQWTPANIWLEKK